MPKEYSLGNEESMRDCRRLPPLIVAIFLAKIVDFDLKYGILKENAKNSISGSYQHFLSERILP
jgi:hypothetical protein